MDKLSWVKELVQAEQRMEESGVVESNFGFDPQKELSAESVQFLETLRAAFVEASTSFNQLKLSTVGRIKIFGISNTHADFMLFRNGYKLVFSAREPGVIGIRFDLVGSTFSHIPGMAENATKPPQVEEDFITARWGAFGDLLWTYQEQPIKIDNLVRYYMTRFIRESSK